MITGRTYDILKFAALVFLPALGTLYFTLASIWGLPAAEQVVGTIVAIDTFLGVILQISASKFNQSDQKYDGDMVVYTEPNGHRTFSLELQDDPDLEMTHKDEIRFKVVRR